MSELPPIRALVLRISPPSSRAVIENLLCACPMEYAAFIQEIEEPMYFSQLPKESQTGSCPQRSADAATIARTGTRSHRWTPK